MSLTLPLTASFLSPLFGYESYLGHVRKLPVTWGQVVVFARYSSFLHQLQMASQNLAAMVEKVMKNEIPNSHQMKWGIPCNSQDFLVEILGVPE